MGVTVSISGLPNLNTIGKEIIKKAVEEGADVLVHNLEKNSPIDTGLLVKSWKKGDFTVKGNLNYIDIENTADRYRKKSGLVRYAQFPNNGFYHVRAKRFIAGQHFVEKSEFETSVIANEIVNKYIKGLL